MQEGSLVSPLSLAMKSVGRLHTLLSGTKQGPSAKLAETLGYVLESFTDLNRGKIMVNSRLMFL